MAAHYVGGLAAPLEGFYLLLEIYNVSGSHRISACYKDLYESYGK